MDKSNYYLNSINQRLIKIYKVKNTDKSMDLEEIIATIKPPIFWKDKEIVKKQVNAWELRDLKAKMYQINEVETLVKSNSKNN